MNKDSNFLHLRKAYGLSPLVQIVLISTLFSIMTLAGFIQYKQSGQMFGYPLAISLLFVPIYEEVIFRGLILGELIKLYSIKKAIFISCILFSLWHLKNIFWLTPQQLLSQILFAGLIFAPITSYIAINKKTIWIGVILHYLNNLLAGIAFFSLVFNLGK